MVTENYLIISSDTHAGLPDAQYKEYLEPQYREAFDEDLVQRAALRAPMNAQVEKLEFVKDWYDENEEGLRGGWDAARRDAELEADGVVGEVIFPDADAVLGGASAPFGAGLGASGEYDPTLLMAGAQAHNRWLAELCSDSPDRRCGLAIVPILARHRRCRRRDPEGQDLRPGRHPHSCDVASVPSVQRPPIRADLGRVRGPRSWSSTPTRGPHRARRSAPISASMPTRPSSGRCDPCGSCSGPVRSNATPASSSPSPKGDRGGRPTSCGDPTSRT